MTKNSVQPTASTMKPVDALATVRGIAMKLVKRANWVAVKALLVSLAMKAVSAIVPRPTPRYSPLTARNSPVSVWPAWLSHTNGTMVNQLHEAEQPQSPVDADLEHDNAAKYSTGDAGPQPGHLGDGTDLAQAVTHVDVKRRGQRRGHVVPQLVEKQEGEDG